MTIELERTFLLKEAPKDLGIYKFIEVIDIYIPWQALHPTLRIRKRGGIFEATKKSPISGDSSEQEEQTISLSEEEFSELVGMKGKRLRKIRYYYPSGGQPAEIDFFLDELAGLAVVDFEFESVDKKEQFLIPDFCLAEVTQEECFAGGFLAGKQYSDIQNTLERYGYEKIFLLKNLN